MKEISDFSTFVMYRNLKFSPRTPSVTNIRYIALVFSHSLFTRKDTQMNGNTTFVKLKVSRWVLLKRATIMVTPLRCSSFCPRRYTIHTQCSPAFRYWQTRWSAQECWHIREARCYQNGWIFEKVPKNSLYIEDIVYSKIVPKCADANVSPKTTTRPLYSHWKYPQCYMYRWCQLFHVMISFGGFLAEYLPCFVGVSPFFNVFFTKFNIFKNMFELKINSSKTMVHTMHCIVSNLAKCRCLQWIKKICVSDIFSV